MFKFIKRKMLEKEKINERVREMHVLSRTKELERKLKDNERDLELYKSLDISTFIQSRFQNIGIDGIAADLEGSNDDRLYIVAEMAQGELVDMSVDFWYGVRIITQGGRTLETLTVSKGGDGRLISDTACGRRNSTWSLTNFCAQYIQSELSYRLNRKNMQHVELMLEHKLNGLEHLLIPLTEEEKEEQKNLLSQVSYQGEVEVIV